jgi:hypothetical protein
MAKRNHYTDKQRAAAVAMLEGMGYPDKKGALSAVSNHTGIPLPTLYRWFHGVQNPPPSELVNETKIDLAAAIRRELANLFPAMDGARLGADYKELATAAGILIDKLQLLEGKPTAINEERASDARSKLTDLITRRTTRDGAVEDTQLLN